MLPLLRSDFYHFSDEPHIANLYQMIRGLQTGQFPVRWAPDMLWGYGYPLFNFYYPLPFYVGALFFTVTNSLIVSLKLVFLTTIPLSALFMYMFLRNHTKKFGAFAGAIIYVYTPYRALDLYVRGALGEAVAFVFFPLVLHLTYQVIISPSWRKTSLLAAGIGFFVLSHNLSPIFFLPWSFLYALVLTINKNKLLHLSKVIIGYVFGLLISFFWWFPAFLEKNWMQKQTPFNYTDHFPFIKQLIYSPWKYGASLPGPYDDMSFQIGIVNLVLLVFLSFILLRNVLRKEKKDLLLKLFFLTSTFFFIVLMNIRTAPIWELSGLANYIQFPWRLLLMTTFLTPTFVIFLNYQEKTKSLIGLVLAFLSVFLTVGYFRPSEYFKPNDDYFLNRFFANRTTKGESREISKEYANYSEDYLLLPTWSTERPQEFKKQKLESEDFEIKDFKKFSEISFQANLEGENSAKVYVNNLYYPGWQVIVDGQKTNIYPSGEAGRITFDLTPGEHSVRIFWEETNRRKTANFISIASFSLIAVMFLKKDNNKK